MTRRQKQALADLNIETERYYIDGWPPIWGLELRRNNKTLAVIETSGDNSDDHTDRFFKVRHFRSTAAERDATGDRATTQSAEVVSTHRLQRLAIADVIRRAHRL